MAVWVKEPATKPEDQSSVPRILTVEGENRFPSLSSERWGQAAAHYHVVKSYKINFPVLLNAPKGGQTLHSTGNSLRLGKFQNKQTNKQANNKK